MRTNYKSLSLFTLYLLLTFMVSACANSKNKAETTSSVSTPVPVAVTTINTDYIDDDGLFADEDDLFSDDEPLENDKGTEISDPFYYFNKAMFHVNDKLYFWVLRPAAIGYKAITPQIFRVGVANFFHNITMPIRFTSNLLQGDLKSTGTELGRFVVNSTVGVLGVMDPAANYLDWQPSDQDMGLTLGKYGIGNGPYIVWPIFGPSTLRDTVGRSTDYFLSPLTYLQPDKLSITVQAVDKVNATYFSLGDYEAFKQAYIDPYERMKEFYIEYREERVAEE